METPLPPNWRSAKDSDGKEYYFNELTGETSWTFPESEDKPKPAAEQASAAALSTDTVQAVVATDAASSDGGTLAMPPMYGNGGGGGGGGSRGGGGDFSMMLGELLPKLVVVLVCSLVLLLQSAIAAGQFPSGFLSYGVAVGCISLGFTLIFLFYAKKKPAALANYVVPKLPGELSPTQLLALFLTAWWTPAAIVLTFFQPFTRTSNAYFAIWAAFIASLLSLSTAFNKVNSAFKSMSAVQQDANVKSLAGLCVSSAVVLFSSIEHTASGNGVFGLVAGIFSLLLSALLYYLVDKRKVGASLKKLVAFVLAGLWLAAAIVLTYVGPFTDTGNGYFGTWFAAFCAISFAYQEFFGVDMELAGRVRKSFSFKPMESSIGAHDAPSMPSATPGGLA